MDADRAERVVAQLQDRRVMAHVDRSNVYELGIRVVLDAKIEALWNVDGAAGLDAEIVSDGVLIGYVPHVAGSEDYTDEQIVDCIATTRYTLEGLHPPTDRVSTGKPRPAGRHRAPAAPATGRRHRLTGWLRHAR